MPQVFAPPPSPENLIRRKKYSLKVFTSTLNICHLKDKKIVGTNHHFSGGNNYGGVRILRAFLSALAKINSRPIFQDRAIEILKPHLEMQRCSSNLPSWTWGRCFLGSRRCHHFKKWWVSFWMMIYHYKNGETRKPNGLKMMAKDFQGWALVCV